MFFLLIAPICKRELYKCNINKIIQVVRALQRSLAQTLIKVRLKSGAGQGAQGLSFSAGFSIALRKGMQGLSACCA